jgi:predicted CxxxxCH...CXXCH cytochrome family protein
MFVQVHADYCALDRPEESLPVVRSNIRAVADSRDFGVHMCGSGIFACRLARSHTCSVSYCHNDGTSSLSYPWCKSFLVSTPRAVYHTIRPTTTTKNRTYQIVIKTTSGSKIISVPLPSAFNATTLNQLQFHAPENSGAATVDRLIVVLTLGVQALQASGKH